MLRPVEGLTFPHRVGIVSPQGRYSDLVSVYLVGFSLWFHAGFPHRLGIPGALRGRYSTFLGGTSFDQGLGIAVDRDGAWGVLSEAQTLVCRESIHDRAYLSIGVTSSSGAGLCKVSGGGDSRGIGAGLCRILDMNFREYLFHALR